MHYEHAELLNFGKHILMYSMYIERDIEQF